MQQVYDWTAKRAGGAITVEHSTGKLTGISSLRCEGGLLIAMRFDGVKYVLAFQSAPAAPVASNTRPIAGCIETLDGTYCATVDNAAIKAGFSTSSSAVDYANYEIDNRMKAIRIAEHHPV